MRWSSVRRVFAAAAVVVSVLATAACSDDTEDGARVVDPLPFEADVEDPTFPLPAEDPAAGIEAGTVVFHGTAETSRNLWTIGTDAGELAELAVDGYDGIAGASVAPDGVSIAALAWSPGRFEQADTLLVGTLEAGFEPIVHDAELDMWCIRWFPGGERLLLTAFVEDEMTPVLLSVALDGTTSTHSTPGGRFDCAIPVDDDLAVLTYLGIDVNLVGLALVELSTGEAGVLFEKVGCLLYGGAVSPDGTELVTAAACDEPDDSGIHVLDIDSGDVDHLLVAEVSFPAFSPSGEWITFGVYESPSAARSTVWAMRRDGSGVRQLSDAPGIQPAWVTSPAPPR
jgi:hypothetical protein